MLASIGICWRIRGAGDSLFAFTGLIECYCSFIGETGYLRRRLSCITRAKLILRCFSCSFHL
jgi:hypothetical protein